MDAKAYSRWLKKQTTAVKRAYVANYCRACWAGQHDGCTLTAPSPDKDRCKCGQAGHTLTTAELNERV